MKEYQEIMGKYRQQKQYQKRVVILTVGLILFASLIVLLDLVRVNPFLVYLLGMGITLYYAIKMRVENDSYPYLKKYLKKAKPNLLKQEELVFFIDCQMNQLTQTENANLLTWLTQEQWQEKKACTAFNAKLAELITYYHFLKEHMDEQSNQEMTLEKYHQLFNNNHELV